MTLDCFGDAIQGARDYQEDSFEICHGSDDLETCLAIVCDGMGGHTGGALASRTVIKAFVNHFLSLNKDEDIKQALNASLEAAHLALVEQIEKHAAPSDMGTTLVAAFIDQADIYWISVGDSHLYHYRKGQLKKLNADHSMGPVLDELAQIGRISAEEAQNDPRRNSIRSCISADDISLIDIGAEIGLLQEGDSILLASDGLDTLTPAVIEKTMTRHQSTSAMAAVQALLKQVKTINRPHQDNTAAVVASLKPKQSLLKRWLSRIY